MIYVTDTHPLVWFLEGNARLSPAARNALSDATAQIVIPTLVLTEIAFLYSKSRIATAVSDVLSHIASASNCILYPLDEVVVTHLPTALEIHDAVITATAIVFRDVLGENVTLITKDAEITASGLISVLW
jgi:PIN domain nuclease of toxin-antitoxin system